MKNVVARKYILICVAITIVFSFVMWRNVVNQNKVYEKEINSTLVNIIGLIKEEYPNISDEEIIKILNNEEFSKDGTEVLEKYGISDELAIEKMQDRQAKFIIVNIAIIALCAGSVVSVFVIYLINRKKKINYLDNYLQKVSNGKYYTELEKESEDELNRLKDSLYKITVMLKEDSENKRLQNEAILNSVANISHQLKTPLTSTLVMLDNMIDTDEIDTKTQNEFLHDIKKEILNINFLIQSLLKLSKFDASTITFIKENVLMSDIIKKSIENVSLQADLRNVEIIVKSESKDSFLKCDFRWQVEALTNILKNSLDHSEENSQITLIYSKNKAYLELKIIDFGEGISKEDLPHIFERFYKGKNAKEDSIGIGLALAKTIIEEDNGMITVDSSKKGTTFTIKYFFLL